MLTALLVAASMAAAGGVALLGARGKLKAAFARELERGRAAYRDLMEQHAPGERGQFRPWISTVSQPKRRLVARRAA